MAMKLHYPCFLMAASLRLILLAFNFFFLLGSPPILAMGAEGLAFRGDSEGSVLSWTAINPTKSPRPGKGVSSIHLEQESPVQAELHGVRESRTLPKPTTFPQRTGVRPSDTSGNKPSNRFHGENRPSRLLPKDPQKPDEDLIAFPIHDLESLAHFFNGYDIRPGVMPVFKYSEAHGKPSYELKYQTHYILTPCSSDLIVPVFWPQSPAKMGPPSPEGTARKVGKEKSKMESASAPVSPRFGKPSDHGGEQSSTGNAKEDKVSREDGMETETREPQRVPHVRDMNAKGVWHEKAREGPAQSTRGGSASALEPSSLSDEQAPHITGSPPQTPLLDKTQATKTVAKALPLSYAEALKLGKGSPQKILQEFNVGTEIANEGSSKPARGTSEVKNTLLDAVTWITPKARRKLRLGPGNSLGGMGRESENQSQLHSTARSFAPQVPQVAWRGGGRRRPFTLGDYLPTRNPKPSQKHPQGMTLSERRKLEEIAPAPTSNLWEHEEPVSLGNLHLKPQKWKDEPINELSPKTSVLNAVPQTESAIERATFTNEVLNPDHQILPPPDVHEEVSMATSAKTEKLQKIEAKECTTSPKTEAWESKEATHVEKKTGQENHDIDGTPLIVTNALQSGHFEREEQAVGASSADGIMSNLQSKKGNEFKTIELGTALPHMDSNLVKGENEEQTTSKVIEVENNHGDSERSFSTLTKSKVKKTGKQKTKGVKVGTLSLKASELSQQNEKQKNKDQEEQSLGGRTQIAPEEVVIKEVDLLNGPKSIKSSHPKQGLSEPTVQSGVEKSRETEDGKSEHLQTKSVERPTNVPGKVERSNSPLESIKHSDVEKVLQIWIPEQFRDFTGARSKDLLNQPHDSKGKKALGREITPKSTSLGVGETTLRSIWRDTAESSKPKAPLESNVNHKPFSAQDSQRLEQVLMENERYHKIFGSIVSLLSEHKLWNKDPEKEMEVIQEVLFTTHCGLIAQNKKEKLIQDQYLRMNLGQNGPEIFKDLVTKNQSPNRINIMLKMAELLELEDLSTKRASKMIFSDHGLESACCARRQSEHDFHFSTQLLIQKLKPRKEVQARVNKFLTQLNKAFPD